MIHFVEVLYELRCKYELEYYCLTKTTQCMMKLLQTVCTDVFIKTSAPYVSNDL